MLSITVHYHGGSTSAYVALLRGASCDVILTPLPLHLLEGLDALAAQKRAERAAAESSGEQAAKRMRLAMDDDGSDEFPVPAPKRPGPGNGSEPEGQLMQRQLRASRMETPSHPGGVSAEAVDAQRDRERRDRDRGLYASTSGGDRDRDRERRGSDRSRDRDDRDYR